MIRARRSQRPGKFFSGAVRFNRVKVDFRCAAEDMEAAIDGPRDEFRANVVRDKRSASIGEHHRKRIVLLIVSGNKIAAITGGF